MTDGFRVAPDALLATGQTTQQHADAVANLLSTVSGATLPPSAFGGLLQSSVAARAHADDLNRSAHHLTAAQSHLTTISAGLRASGTGYRAADVSVARSYLSLLPGGRGGR